MWEGAGSPQRWQTVDGAMSLMLSSKAVAFVTNRWYCPKFGVGWLVVVTGDDKRSLDSFDQ